MGRSTPFERAVGACGLETLAQRTPRDRMARDHPARRHVRAAASQLPHRILKNCLILSQLLGVVRPQTLDTEATSQSLQHTPRRQANNAATSKKQGIFIEKTLASARPTRADDCDLPRGFATLAR